jgi:hypothetical protein
MKRNLKIAVDPNTLFANVDGIKNALDGASKPRKCQGVAQQTRNNLETIGEEIQKGLKYVRQSKNTVLYISIVLVDEVPEIVR